MNFKETIEKYKEIINERLKKLLESKEVKEQVIREIYNYTKDHVLSGGKRLRAIALIMAYKAVGGKDEELAYGASLSIELLHNSSLVHDDIMDEDETRRNQPTVYKKIKDNFLKDNKEIKYNGNLFDRLSSRVAVSNAVIAGNILYALGSHCLNDKDALKIYNEAFIVINEGQLLDLASETKDIPEQEYLEIAEKKTAYLFKAAIEIGARLGEATEKQINALNKYAINVAIAFQLHDDIMDISEEMQKGHEIGSDIKKGKRTLLVIKALELSNGKNELLEILKKEEKSEQDVKRAIEIINKSGALNYVKDIIQKRLTEAKKELEKAELTKEGFEFFSELAGFMVERRV